MKRDQRLPPILVTAEQRAEVIARQAASGQSWQEWVRDRLGIAAAPANRTGPARTVEAEARRDRIREAAARDPRPTIRQIAAEIGCSERYVHRVLAEQ
jgi:AraC-like DNA-binding protein